ncbi:PREDICTED: inositol oxygenase [Calidris pugnax]|nr:PREDICTED: inositol oxygenase [Calidris pugnax]
MCGNPPVCGDPLGAWRSLRCERTRVCGDTEVRGPPARQNPLGAWRSLRCERTRVCGDTEVRGPPARQNPLGAWRSLRCERTRVCGDTEVRGPPARQNPLGAWRSLRCERTRVCGDTEVRGPPARQNPLGSPGTVVALCPRNKPRATSHPRPGVPSAGVGDAAPPEGPESGKAKAEYRNYRHPLSLQSAQYGSCSLRKMGAMEALELLDQLVDESDPDVDFPNSFHAYQTAEGIRRAHPDKDWFHLVGLLHDLGKVLALFGEPQWAVVGDTFPVGCKVQKSVVFGDTTFRDNPDTKDPLYSTEYGMYQPRCGLENVLMSWGHDEYMYRVMKFNRFTLPKEAFYMVRFHSFYPWHAHGDYMHLCSEEDLRMLPWVRELNKFDLYTKQEELPDVQQLRGYYQALIDKYCPGQLCW